jgi:hypothetical protein
MKYLACMLNITKLIQQQTESDIFIHPWININSGPGSEKMVIITVLKFPIKPDFLSKLVYLENLVLIGNLRSIDKNHIISCNPDIIWFSLTVLKFSIKIIKSSTSIIFFFYNFIIYIIKVIEKNN